MDSTSLFLMSINFILAIEYPWSRHAPDYIPWTLHIGVSMYKQEKRLRTQRLIRIYVHLPRLAVEQELLFSIIVLSTLDIISAKIVLFVA